MKWLISRNGLMVGRGSPTKVKEKNNNITSSSNNSTMVPYSKRAAAAGAPPEVGVAKYYLSGLHLLKKHEQIEYLLPQR